MTLRERIAEQRYKLYGRRVGLALRILPADLRSPVAHGIMAVTDLRIAEIEKGQFLDYFEATANRIALELAEELDPGGFHGYRVGWDDRPIL